jgi:hypothetical protein
MNPSPCRLVSLCREQSYARRICQVPFRYLRRLCPRVYGHVITCSQIRPSLSAIMAVESETANGTSEAMAPPIVHTITQRRLHVVIAG